MQDLDSGDSITIEFLADSRERMLAYEELAELADLNGSGVLAGYARKLAAKYRTEYRAAIAGDPRDSDSVRPFTSRCL